MSGALYCNNSCESMFRQTVISSLRARFAQYQTPRLASPHHNLSTASLATCLLASALPSRIATSSHPAELQSEAMATANMYAMSLRNDGRTPEKGHGDGVPFFVPHLAKVKTNIVCQTHNKHLLFNYEKAAGAEGSLDGPLSPTTSALPYRKQGSKTHYTDENMRKRQKLMDDRRVLAGIARFWDTFPVIRQGQTAIERHDFVDVFMKFYKALVAPHEVCSCLLALAEEG